MLIKCPKKFVKKQKEKKKKKQIMSTLYDFI